MFRLFRSALPIHIGLLLISFSLSARAAYDVNLVVNGNAEASAISDSASNGPAPSGWTRTAGGYTSITKNNAYWVLQYPPVGPGINSNFFVGGAGYSLSRMQQQIDLSAYASDIDAGGVASRLNARVGGWQYQQDSTQFFIRYYNAANTLLATTSTAETSNFPARDTNGDGAWDYQLNLGPIPALVASVPAGARYAVIEVVGRRYQGADLDSYVDDISFQVHHSAVYHVSTTGSDSNSGLSWAQAKRTVAAAANLAISGDQILVAGGTYTNTHIGLQPGVRLLGGYAGTDPNPDARDTTANETILDGNGSGAVIYVAPGQASLLKDQVDGFTITHGNSGFYLDNANVIVSHNHIVANNGSYGAGINGPGGAPQIIGNLIENNKGTGNGGGIHLVASMPYIAGNIIQNNQVDGYGAGIAMGSCQFTIKSNQILNNTANYAGGIYLSAGTGFIDNNTINGNTSKLQNGGGIDSSATPISITNNTIKNNASPWTGGILLAYTPPEITVTDNVISDNSGGAAGGFACFHSSGILARNTINGNVSAGGAGGVWVADNSSLEIADNTVSKNKASNGNGGGLWLVDSGLKVYRNLVSDNQCLGGYGGGLFSSNNVLDMQFNRLLRNTAQYNGGGAEVSATSAIVANNLFDGNEAQYNCALTFAYGSDFKALNNTFVNTKTHNGGITLGLYQASATIANNIFAFNPAGGIFSNPGGVVVADTHCYNNATYGNAWDYAGQVQVNSPLFADPLFVNAAGGDYRLQPTSPAIDAGNNAYVAAGGLDLAGLLRVIGFVDIGAYETQTPLLDVSALIQVTRGGFRRNPGTGRWQQTITLTNTSANTIVGPISLVMDSLSSNATLYNGTGMTALHAPLGSPYRDLAVGSLTSGSSVTFTLEFTNPSNARITYTSRILAGPGKR